MPLVCFNVDKFRGEQVDCSPAARRRSDFIYKLLNLKKMELTHEEITASIHRDYFHALCAENRSKVKAPGRRSRRQVDGEGPECGPGEY